MSLIQQTSRCGLFHVSLCRESLPLIRTLTGVTSTTTFWLCVHYCTWQDCTFVVNQKHFLLDMARFCWVHTREQIYDCLVLQDSGIPLHGHSMLCMRRTCSIYACMTWPKSIFDFCFWFWQQEHPFFQQYRRGVGAVAAMAAPLLADDRNCRKMPKNEEKNVLRGPSHVHVQYLLLTCT